MALSPCISKKHQEYDCRIKWSVSHMKFKYPQWCAACKEVFESQRKEFGDK